MLYTNSDGGARGNPGPGAIGILIRKDNKIIKTYSKKVGRVTNNIAEYLALIKALELAFKHGEEVNCILDSELIVKQLKGEYRVKNIKLKDLFGKVRKLEQRFRKVNYKHVSRWDKFQQLADSLLNKELNKE